jgi:preprotein translocase subunit YajC
MRILERLKIDGNTIKQNKPIVNLIVIVLIILVAMFLGKRLREQEKATIEHDKKANAYFDSLEKAKSDTALYTLP